MEAQGSHERYEATGTRHDNPAYIPDDDTDPVYKHKGGYNQEQISDSPHKSFSTIVREVDDKESSKESQSRVGPVCVGATILVIALLIAGVIVTVIMTVVVNDDVIYPDVLVVGDSSTKGEITLTNNTWDSNYENSSSEEYISLESEFIEAMDYTFRRSTLTNVYNQTTVEQFRQGSVIVVFLVHLNGATQSAKQIQVGDHDIEQLQEDVEMATSSDVLSVLNSQTDDNYLGELPVGDVCVTEVSVTIEVEAGNSENQPPETEPPSVTCPDDITQNTDDESPTAIVTWEEPFAEDNSGEIDRIESQPESGSEFKIGETEVTVLAYDAADNIGLCTFTVTVIDNEPPVIMCPSDISNKTQMGELYGYITWTIPPPTDNSGDLVTYETNYQPGEFPIGSYTVNATATDVSGNTAWCTFMFVVEPLCHPEFCLNEGNCSFSPLDNAYVCQCPKGILGKNCESESIFVNSSYIFNSPNYPSKYPDDFEYTWYFSTNPGSQLLITFNDICTEPHFDYIYVREGSNITAISDLLLRWSGTGSPNELRILSSENLIWVTFDSDESVACHGFEAMVEVTNMTREDLNCSTEFDCDNGVCLPQSKVCDGDRECGNNADETIENCRGTCGPSDFICYDGECVDWFKVCDGYPDCSRGEDEFDCPKYIFVNSSYIFNSPNYPSDYPNNIEYTWYFTTDLGSHLLITFNNISTEPGFDYIYVREGSNISAISDLLLRWSGKGSPNELRILSSENLIWVTFDSDESVADYGFEATIEVTNMTREELNCGTEFDCDNGVCLPQSRVCDGDRECGNNADERNVNCSDVFVNAYDQVYLMSPNYPNGYPDNFNVSWNISTLKGYILKMQFISFQTEPFYDFITIDEFDDITFTQLIKKWSGNDTNLQVSTSTHQMRVNFYSDGSVNAQGFQGIVTSSPGNAKSSCPDSYFDCDNGACFSMEAACDMEVNCGNGADAESCSGTD